MERAKHKKQQKTATRMHEAPKTTATHEEVRSEVEEPEPYFSGVQTLLSWTAPVRHYRKRQRQYFINIFFIVIAIEIILVLFSQYVLMFVVLSLAFLSYALAITPPREIRYRVSTEGLMIDEHFYLWQELYDFYFKERHHVTTLHVRTQSFFPGELVILTGDADKEEIKEILLLFLPFREYVKPDFTERAGDWLAKTFPLDKHPSEFASK